MPRSLVHWIAVCAITLLSLDLLTPSRAFPWFDKGHRIVGLIAQANLTTDARNEVEKILPRGTTLADAASPGTTIVPFILAGLMRQK